jgi:hypothetical protein
LLTEACGIPLGRSADAVDSKLKEINSVELGVQRQASAVTRGADCIYVLARVLLDIAVDS